MRLLKAVSRSFYLSLRLLPRPMRGAASLGYLLARTSDTLADDAAIPAATRIDCLDAFARAVAGGRPPQWPATLLETVSDPAERRLLAQTTGMLGMLDRLPAAEARLVREVAATIISGQKLDLERFGGARHDHPRCLASAVELEDYTWRVAGCVGEFWTNLGFLTLGTAFSCEPRDALAARGAAYGKALQLVNILRDTGADMAAGRCYLPVSDPLDTALVLREHRHWLDRAGQWLEEGSAYAGALAGWRLRAASALPAILARGTLDLLREAGPEVLRKRVKLPRRDVYAAVLRAFLFKHP